MGMIRSLAVLALGAGYATAQDVTAGPSVTDVGEYFMRMPLSVVYDKASDTLSVDMPKANLEELMVRALLLRCTHALVSLFDFSRSS